MHVFFTTFNLFLSTAKWYKLHSINCARINLFNYLINFKSNINMKINKNDIPIMMQTPDSVLRNIRGYDRMTIAFNELPKGFDFTPLLHGLNNNSCHCHIGIILFKVQYVLFMMINLRRYPEHVMFFTCKKDILL